MPEVTAVWLRKNHAHLGNKIQVVEVNGQWYLLTEQVSDDGPISHIFEESAILDAPLDPMNPDDRVS